MVGCCALISLESLAKFAIGRANESIVGSGLIIGDSHCAGGAVGGFGGSIVGLTGICGGTVVEVVSLAGQNFLTDLR